MLDSFSEPMADQKVDKKRIELTCLPLPVRQACRYPRLGVEDIATVSPGPSLDQNTIRVRLVQVLDVDDSGSNSLPAVAT